VTAVTHPARAVTPPTSGPPTGVAGSRPKTGVASSRPQAPHTRKERQRLVRELVARYAVGSQAELVALLEAHGVEATQATVSRDLDELGIGKLRGADGIAFYALPEPGGLAQILRQFVVGIDASGNLAVVRTTPGAAAAVAGAIDAAGVPGVLATVQGDDTLLVVAVEGIAGREVADRLAAVKHARPSGPSVGPELMEDTPG
jgi:transcriptional regulator of arginine metabolism